MEVLVLRINYSAAKLKFNGHDGESDESCSCLETDLHCAGKYCQCFLAAAQLHYPYLLFTAHLGVVQPQQPQKDDIVVLVYTNAM